MKGNEHRNEVVFHLDGKEYAVRPSIDLVAKIEANFGGCMAIAQRIAANSWSVTEIIGVVQVAVGSVRGAPSQREIRDLAFDAGPMEFLSPVSDLCVGAMRGTINRLPSPEDGGEDAPEAGEGGAQVH